MNHCLIGAASVVRKKGDQVSQFVNADQRNKMGVSLEEEIPGLLCTFKVLQLPQSTPVAVSKLPIHIVGHSVQKVTLWEKESQTSYSAGFRVHHSTQPKGPIVASLSQYVRSERDPSVIQSPVLQCTLWDAFDQSERLKSIV